MVALIPIFKGDLLDVKIEIYHQTMRVIIKGACNHRLTNITNKDWFLCLALVTLGWLYIIALEAVAVEGILMICADRNVWQYHLIIGSMSVDYEEQVVITGIKSGMQCSMCHILPEERKNLCKVWPRQTYKSMCVQVAQQNTIEWMEENGSKHPDYMHSITNFAESHFFMNIHQCMLLDILYQLLKSVVVGTHMLQ